jgi:glycosyltransferase involved in cell wall biosynthesis
VFLAGWHDQSELPDFLNASDLIVHASVREQFGQVLVEGMACGVPPIAVNRAGPATIVEDGCTGWLIEPDDRSAMVAAMVAAVNDPAERRARGLRARDEALRHYTWAAIGAAYAGELREMFAARIALVDRDDPRQPAQT